MTRRLRRAAIVLAGVTGLLALWEQAAHAFISYNHCEPLRRLQ
jgi:hypothetical protein